MSRRKRHTPNLGRTLPAPLPVRTTVERVRDIDAVLRWFEDFLDAPTQLDLERFWFKAEAGLDGGRRQIPVNSRSTAATN